MNLNINKWTISSLSFQPDWSWENIFHKSPWQHSKSFKQGQSIYPSYNCLNLASSTVGAPLQQCCGKNEPWIWASECSPRKQAKTKPGKTVFPLLPGKAWDVYHRSLFFTSWWLDIKHQRLPLEGVKITRRKSVWSARKCLTQGVSFLRARPAMKWIPEPLDKGGSGFKVYISWV